MSAIGQRHRLAPRAAIATVMGVFAGAVHGQTTDTAQDRFTLSLSPGFSHAISADLDGADGSVAVSRAFVPIKLGHDASDRLRVSLDVLPEWSWYEFDDVLPSSLVASATDLPEDFFSIQFRPGVRFAQNESWQYVAGGILQFAMETEGDTSDTATFGGYGGVRHVFSDRFALTLGVAGRSRLEDDALVFPLIGVDWNFSDRVTVTVEGLTARITAKVSDVVSTFLGVAYEPREFRLNDVGVFADGVLRDDRVPVSIGVTWTAAPSWTWTLTGGLIAWQEYQYHNDAGDTLAEVESDPTMFVGISSTIKF